MSYNTKNLTQQGGEKTLIGGEIEILAGAKIKADEGAIVEGFDSGGYVLPKASADALGGVCAEDKDETYTVEVKIGEDNKLYVPAYSTPPSSDRLVCTFSQSESVWTCDKTTSEILTAFSQKKAVVGYYIDNDSTFKFELVYVHEDTENPQIDFRSSYDTSMYAKYTDGEWDVKLPD